MKRKRALLKYDDAPPSTSGLEVEVYLADEVDAVLKRQANAALSGMNAAKAISSAQVQQAYRLKVESSPESLESERAANAELTEENDRLRADLELLKRAGVSVRDGKDGHRFVEIVSDVQQ